MANTEQPDTTKKVSNKPASGTTVFSHHLSFQLTGGTQGLGGDLRYGVSPGLSFRLGGSFIPINTSNAFSFPDFPSNNTANVNFYNVHLLADFVPFKGARGFRLVGGAAYLYKADGHVNVIPTGTYNYNSLSATGAEVGNLDLNVSWKGIAPYAGIGLFRSFPSHVFNFNLDLGCYYLSQPRSHIVGTNMLQYNYQLEPQLNENMKDDRWLPVIQLNFNFKLK